jgi:hypothetical protein
MGGKMMEKLHYLGNDEYFFEFELANNKIDVDNEQFDITALVSMKELFLGRTGFVIVGEKTYNPKIFETYIYIQFKIYKLIYILWKSLYHL